MPFKLLGPSARTNPIIVLGALAVWLLLPLGWRPLMLPDEGRYVGVAWGMLASGDWLTPTLHGLPYFHKPPLMYWIDAAALGLLGPHQFAARLAPALGAWLLGAALYLDWRDRFGPDVAGAALVTLAVTPLYFFAGQFANLDMLVAGWITVSVLAAVRVVEADRGRHLRWLGMLGLSLAMGVLAKGLIGVVLPCLVIGAWLAWRRDGRGALRLLHPLGWGLALALAAPWFWAMQQRFPEFSDYFFLEQQVRRYAQEGFNNVQPWWFYLAVLPLLTLPWSLGLRSAWMRWRASDQTNQLGLLIVWIGAVLLFFSMPRSKLVGYVLPALAPWLSLLAVPQSRGRGWRWAVAAMVLICLGATAALALAHGRLPSNRDLGLALAARHRDSEPVVLVNGSYFDLPFYARLAHPPYVLADWDNPRWARQDDWHKELLDAARFAQHADAARLIGVDEGRRMACSASHVWWVTALDGSPPEHGQARFNLVKRGGSAALWESHSLQGEPCR